MKHADQAMAKRFSAAGCGCGSLMSMNLSLLLAAPSRPPVVCVRPVKTTFSFVAMAGSFRKGTGGSSTIQSYEMYIPPAAIIADVRTGAHADDLSRTREKWLGRS